MNSLSRSTILRDFQNQEYQHKISKYRTRLAEKPQDVGDGLGAYVLNLQIA